MGSRILKYLSVLALISAVTLGFLLVAAHLLVTPERIRDAVVPVLEQKLQRKIHLEAVDVSLFSGVTLTRLAVVDPHSNDLLVAADKVVLRYQLWPLLMQRVVFDEVRVEHPQVNIERLTDGRFNLAMNQEAIVLPVASASSLPATPSASDMDLLISDLVISRGEILFKDNTFGSPPHIYKMSEFDLRVGNLSFERQASVVFWGKFNGAPVDIEGTFSLRSQSFDLKVIADHLDLIPLQPYYRSWIDGRLDGLTLNSDVRIRGGKSTPLSLVGKLSLTDLDLLLNSMKDYPLQAKQIDLDLDVAVDRPGEKIQVTTFKADIDGIAMVAQGTVTGLTDVPALDLTVTTPKWELRRVVQQLPRALSRQFINYDPAGSLDGEWKLVGPLSQGKVLLQHGRLDLSAVQMTAGGRRPQIDGQLEIAGKQLDARDLAIRLGDNTLNLTVHSDHWQRPVPEFVVQVRGELFDVAAQSNGTVIRADEPTTGGTDSKGVSSPDRGNPGGFREQHEPGPVDLPVVVRGDLTLEQVVWEDVRVSGVRGDFALNGNVLDLQNVVGRLANGTFRVSTQIDLRRQGFVYQGHVDARDMDLDALVTQFSRQNSGVLTGTGRMQTDFKGAGTQWLRIQQNLSANGDYTIANGRMEGTALMKQLSSLINLPEFSVFRFQQGTGTFKLPTGGQLNYDSRFDGSRARLLSKGTVTFTKEIAATADIYLSPEVVNEMQPGERVKNLLVEKDGWGRVPLLISGRYDRPSLGYNLTVLGHKAAEKVTERLQGKLEEKAGSQAAESLAKPAAELINSALKGLLNPPSK